jgi:hypothetical protein
MPALCSLFSLFFLPTSVKKENETDITRLSSAPAGLDISVTGEE